VLGFLNTTVRQVQPQSKHIGNACRNSLHSALELGTGWQHGRENFTIDTAKAHVPWRRSAPRASSHARLAQCRVVPRRQPSIASMRSEQNPLSTSQMGPSARQRSAHREAKPRALRYCSVSRETGGTSERRVRVRKQQKRQPTAVPPGVRTGQTPSPPCAHRGSSGAGEDFQANQDRLHVAPPRRLL
jgi:hypothetical protein